ncbi:hypothetical protein [Paenibacillus periandrae]|uniref:hypothetical protein n=1 Tax=Paenibacillus periandrae TaxID=1761741 RepID=UPI001F098159|nr:hypothetical protein [Paenibacillus periandrae]
MKKTICFTLSALILVFGSVYFVADQSIKEVTASSFNHKIYDSVNDLTNDSELVVEVTTTSNSKAVELVKNGFDDSYTLTDVKINKVFKDSQNTVTGNVYKSIPVIERFIVRDDGLKPGKTKFIADEYTSLQAGQKYLLFLVWSPERKAYWINALNQGKFNIDNQDLKELNLKKVTRNLKN